MTVTELFEALSGSNKSPVKSSVNNTANGGISVIAGSGNTASGYSAGHGSTGMGATHGYTHSNYYRQYSVEEMTEAFIAGWQENDLLDERSIDEIAKEYLKNKFG